MSALCKLFNNIICVGVNFLMRKKFTFMTQKINKRYRTIGLNLNKLINHKQKRFFIKTIFDVAKIFIPEIFI